MAIPKIHRLAVPVSDIEAAAKFYTELLGTPGKRITPDRHYFDIGGFIIACYEAEAGSWSYDDNQYYYLAVPDLDAARAKVEAGGGRCLTENAEMPWGETMFFAVDPSGSRIGIAQEDKLFSI